MIPTSGRPTINWAGQPQPGEDFRPPPDWGKAKGHPDFSFEDTDLSDLFAAYSGGRQQAGRGGDNVPMPGQDHEANAHINLEDAFRGTDAQRLRLPGNGGKGRNSGHDGNLYSTSPCIHTPYSASAAMICS